MPDRCLARFVQWNDLHLRSDAPHRGVDLDGKEQRRWRWPVEFARAEEAEFVIGVGDIIDGEICSDGTYATLDFPRYREDFEFARRTLLDPLSVPYLPGLGNHENCQGEGLPEQNVGYDKAFGWRWHNYVFCRNGIAFVVIDSSGGHRTPDTVTAARNAFARRAFTRFADRPLIVLTHIPVAPLREASVLAATFGFASEVNRDPSLLELIEEHADRVIAVLSGHLHLSGALLRNGILHYVAAGTCTYPCDLAAYRLYPDRFEARLHALPNEIQPPVASNLHSVPRHPSPPSDARHPDGESYSCGSPDERSVDLPLEGAKRPAEALWDEPLRIWHEPRPDQWECGTA